jgi:hypothetical protein
MAKFILNTIETVIIAAVVGTVVGLMVAAVAYVAGSDEASVNAIGNCASVISGIVMASIVGVRK